jgi:tRNA (guanine-N7-)-methyltransferase
MSKNKLTKFAEMREFPNVYQNFNFKHPQLIGAGGKKVELKGKWCSRHFKNENPLILELACGRGEYTVDLAERYPGRNFVGIDIKGARMYKGAKRAIENDLGNAAFLRIRIEQINEFFREDEVSQIWITFPDPFPKRSDKNKRLTAPIFLGKYRQILNPNGIIHLKTDASSLYEYTLEVANELDWVIVNKEDDRIYAGELPHQDLEVKTNYEIMHLAKGKHIKYVQLKLE